VVASSFRQRVVLAWLYAKTTKRFHDFLTSRPKTLMKLLTNSLLFGLGAAVGNQLSLRMACRKQPHPMPHQFAALLDHPWRLRYRDPSETLGIFGLASGMKVLDLGCGTGLFTVEVARMVGSEGAVYAVDLQAPLVAQTQARIAAAQLRAPGLAPVHCHHSAGQQLPLEPNTIDLALLIATFSQLAEKRTVLSELRRVLKPGGRLALSEELPDPAYLPPAAVRPVVEAAGFHFQGQQGTPFCYYQLYLNTKDPAIVEITPTLVTTVPA